MSVTVENLRERLNASPDQDGSLADALAVAEALVDQRLANAWREVPESVRDLCVLMTAAEINDNGQPMQQGATGVGVDQPTVRTTRDPLAPALPLIRRYVSAV